MYVCFGGVVSGVCCFVSGVWHVGILLREGIPRSAGSVLEEWTFWFILSICRLS